MFSSDHPPGPSILGDIETYRDQLSPAERAVADWVLANPSRTVDVSIAQLAATTRVSEPTVVRFCRRFGLNGFRQLKDRLLAAQQRTESYVHSDVAAGDGAGDAAAKVLESSIRALVDLRSAIATMPFEAAVRPIRDARQVVFAGLGASGHVAQDACHKFFRLGLACTTALDAQTILQQAAITSRRDVFVAVSHTGEWRDLVEAMALARANGALVIAVTDPGSPLASSADVVLGCHAAEDTNLFTPMNSRLVHLAVLDALQVVLALDLGTAGQENLRQSKDALVRARIGGEQEA